MIAGMIGVNSTKFFIIALIPLILSIGIAPILPFVEIHPEANTLKSMGST